MRCAMTYLCVVFFKRFQKKILIGFGAFLLLNFLVFSLRVKMDVNLTTALLALGALFVVYLLYLWIRYTMEPKRKVTVITKVKFTSPPSLLRSIMTYKLRIETEHHIEEKGQERSVKVDELLLTFNSQDHPNVYEHCLYLVSQHSESCMSLAQSKYPNALVEKAPPSLPEGLQKKK